MPEHERRRVERCQVVVIGAGAAGLSAAYWLARESMDFVVLDANARVGDSWRQRWDSLQLFTPARYSALPGMRFPAEPDALPLRDQVADYLEWYAQAFDLPVRCGVRVRRLRRPARFLEVETDDGVIEAENVIVATGAFQVPCVPPFATEIEPLVAQLHSSRYRNPAQLPDGPALVVGAGNSGAQIAMELASTRPVVLAGRAVGSLPRRVLGRDVFDWLWNTSMRPPRDTYLGRRVHAWTRNGGDPLIGITERQIAAAGVSRTPRLAGSRAGRPLLEHGAALDVRSIVWCTGFRSDFSWIELDVLDEHGTPRHVRGISSDVPGLFFLGLPWLYRQNSSLLGGVGADAEHLARAVVSRYGT